MTQTPTMRADEIVIGFNSVTERLYWKASIAGTRVNPEVHFNSRASMVRVGYRVTTGEFTVTFTKSSAAFGDFLASAYRSVEQVMASLKAAGLAFPAVVDEANAVLRIGYDPRTKNVFVAIVRLEDMWLETEPAPFKVPERINSENPLSALDGL